MASILMIFLCSAVAVVAVEVEQRAHVMRSEVSAAGEVAELLSGCSKFQLKFEVNNEPACVYYREGTDAGITWKVDDGSICDSEYTVFQFNDNGDLLNSRSAACHGDGLPTVNVSAIASTTFYKPSTGVNKTIKLNKISVGEEYRLKHTYNPLGQKIVHYERTSSTNPDFNTKFDIVCSKASFQPKPIAGCSKGKFKLLFNPDNTGITACAYYKGTGVDSDGNNAHVTWVLNNTRIGSNNQWICDTKYTYFQFNDLGDLLNTRMEDDNCGDDALPTVKVSALAGVTYPFPTIEDMTGSDGNTIRIKGLKNGAEHRLVHEESGGTKRLVWEEVTVGSTSSRDEFKLVCKTR